MTIEKDKTTEKDKTAQVKITDLPEPKTAEREAEKVKGGVGVKNAASAPMNDC